MDKIDKTYQMHIQYAAHIFERAFINKEYTIKFFTGIQIVIKSDKKPFAHLIGIRKNDVAAFDGSEKVFDAIYTGTDFSINGVFSYPIVSKKHCKKIRLLYEIEKSFETFNKIMVIDFDKNKSISLSTNKFDTDVLLSKYNYPWYMGFNYDTNLNHYIPNSIFKGNISTGLKYFENQTIELIEEVAIFDKTTGTTEVIKISYNEDDYIAIANIIKNQNCVLRAPENIKKNIEKYL